MVTDLPGKLNEVFERASIVCSNARKACGQDAIKRSTVPRSRNYQKRTQWNLLRSDTIILGRTYLPLEIDTTANVLFCRYFEVPQRPAAAGFFESGRHAPRTSGMANIKDNSHLILTGHHTYTNLWMPTQMNTANFTTLSPYKSHFQLPQTTNVKSPTLHLQCHLLACRTRDGAPQCNAPLQASFPVQDPQISLPTLLQAIQLTLKTLAPDRRRGRVLAASPKE